MKNATVNGTKVLGRNDIGILEEGKGADLFLVYVSGLEVVAALEDSTSFLGKVGYHKPTKMTMVNGSIVWGNGVLKNLDEEKISNEARIAAASFR